MLKAGQVNYWRVRGAREERQYDIVPPSLRPDMTAHPSAENGQNGQDGEARPRPTRPSNHGLARHERKTIAKSLVRFFGPPTVNDHLALEL